MASISKPGGVAADRGGVGIDRGGVAADRGGVKTDVPEGTTLYDPRKSYSEGEIIWHAGWEAEGTVVDLAPPRSTFNPFPQVINFRDFQEKAGSEAKPVFMDVNFKSSVGNDKRSGVKTLICNIPVKDYHIPRQPQAKVIGGTTVDNAPAPRRSGVTSDDDNLASPKGGVVPV